MGSGKGKRNAGKREDASRPSRSELRRRLEDAEARAERAERRVARAKKRAKRAEKAAERAAEHAARVSELARTPDTEGPAQEAAAQEAALAQLSARPFNPTANPTAGASTRSGSASTQLRPEVGSPADLAARFPPRAAPAQKAEPADLRSTWVGDDPRSRWVHEDRLGQSRMTWFVISQALLFLPFATATTPALMYTLPVLGVGLNWMLVAGLRACGAAMQHLRREQPEVETIPGGLPVFGAVWTFVPALLFQTAWVLLLLEALDLLVLALVVVPILTALLFGFARAVVPDGARRS